MITPEYCQLMARYNRWMNERLYALLAPIPDDERKRDRGAFFGSMHGTLNHLLWGDRMWLGRFIDEPCTAAAFGADMFDGLLRRSPASAKRPTARCWTGRGKRPLRGSPETCAIRARSTVARATCRAPSR